MQKQFSQSIKFHTILLRGGVYCGPYYIVAKGKLRL